MANILKLYFNTKDKALQSALVQSDTETQPVAMPELMFGDQVPIQIFVVNGDGGFESFSGSGSYSVKLGIGTPGAIATGGTFTLTYSGQTTAAIDFDATAAEVTSALEALLNIGVGDVLVTAIAGGWQVEFKGALALTNVAEMTGTATLLTPESTVDVTTLRAGTGSVNEIQLVRIPQTPAAYLATFSTITNGWSGTLQMNTRGVLEQLGSATSVPLYAELELTDGSGNRRTFGQIPVIVRNQIIDVSSTVPTPRSDYATLADVAAAIAAAGVGHLYVGYADDDSGTGFSLTDGGENYIAVLNSPTVIASPAAGDFAGLWFYRAGGIVYIGYASASDGTGFSTTWSEGLNYVSFVSSVTPLTPVAGDFTTWIKFTGTKRWRQYEINAGAWMPAVVNGAEFNTVEYGANKVLADVWLFDDTTAESIQKNLVLPDIYDLSTVKIKIDGVASSVASAGDKVAFEISAMCVADGENINQAFSTPVEVYATVVGPGKLMKFPASASITIANVPAIADRIWLKISRKPGTANDDMAGDAGLFSAVLGWKESATEPAVW
jgi:hypothetical protein